MENGPKRCFDNIAELVRISRLNHSKRYSQTELSAFLGYKNGQFISNVERGICSIPVKSLKKISDLLGISPEDIKEAVLKDHAQTIDNFFSYYKQQGNVFDSSDIVHTKDGILRESFV
ncbi:MAG: helix-turn-helix transcriptional regulator [Halobacteriovoraceae bacterium]|nr:helix-turn-helix transcriptional regulator [Halobacteriovoraceae bacterium]